MLTPKYFFFQHPAASGLQLLAVACLVCIGHPSSSTAEDNGVSLTPQMGWSSWSFLRSQPTEAIQRVGIQPRSGAFTFVPEVQIHLSKQLTKIPVRICEDRIKPHEKEKNRSY